MVTVPAHSATQLGARIREVRQQRSLSVRELARRLGRSPSLISQIERGVSAPSAGIIYQLATELETSLDFLFGVEAPPEPLDIALPAVVGGGVAGGGVAVTRRRGAAGRQVLDPLVAETPDGEMVQRADARKCLDLASGVRWERLSPDRDPFVDFLEVIYQPWGNAEEPHQAMRHDGREYGLIVNGRLGAKVGFDEYELHAGDSIVFSSSTPHVYWNPTDQVVHAIWMIVHHEPGRA
jgi:DNA-binding XRE family transcriptional regulator/mannose-6-phosphate isomerase-like protein (cupin superfamily)